MPRNAEALSNYLRRSALGVAGMVALGLGGCAGPGSELTAGMLGAEQDKPAATKNASATPQTELQKATAYWGEKFSKSPNTLEYALNYARNLKAMGRKREALAALHHASNYHAQDRELAGEYGRLALDLDQVQTAKGVLAYADDPAKPDWRVISARGTVAAKEGNAKEAIGLFERALALSNRNPSVMNNLAMAYALDGRAADGERLLREAASKGQSAKVQKNLALVLGLQGKYDEAKVVGSRVLPQTTAAEDTQLVRKIVGLDPQPFSPTGVTPRATMAVATSDLPAAAKPAAANGTWATQVATGSTR